MVTVVSELPGIDWPVRVTLVSPDGGLRVDDRPAGTGDPSLVGRDEEDFAQFEVFAEAHRLPHPLECRRLRRLRGKRAGHRDQQCKQRPLAARIERGDAEQTGHSSNLPGETRFRVGSRKAAGVTGKSLDPPLPAPRAGSEAADEDRSVPGPGTRRSHSEHDRQGEHHRRPAGRAALGRGTQLPARLCCSALFFAFSTAEETASFTDTPPPVADLALQGEDRIGRASEHEAAQCSAGAGRPRATNCPSSILPALTR